MQRFVAVAIAAGCILLPACVVEGNEGAEPGPRVEADEFPHESFDAPFPGFNAGAPARELPRAGERPARTDEVELLAAIVGARISEPERVTTVLDELRLESTSRPATSGGWTSRSGPR